MGGLLAFSRLIGHLDVGLSFELSCGIVSFILKFGRLGVFVLRRSNGSSGYWSPL